MWAFTSVSSVPASCSQYTHRLSERLFVKMVNFYLCCINPSKLDNSNGISLHKSIKIFTSDLKHCEIIWLGFRTGFGWLFTCPSFCCVECHSVELVIDTLTMDNARISRCFAPWTFSRAIVERNLCAFQDDYNKLFLASSSKRKEEKRRKKNLIFFLNYFCCIDSTQMELHFIKGTTTTTTKSHNNKNPSLQR